MKETIYQRFASVVEAHGEEPAIIETVRTLTFAQLSEMVDVIARKMPADTKTVGVVLNHTAEMIATILAVLKCGAMYVPAEPEFPRGRIEMMMEEANVDYVLTEAEYANKLRKFPVVTMDRLFPKLPDADPENAYTQDPEQPAYVLYTSGTTGRPKGVCVSNKNVVHYVDAFANEFHPGPGDKMLQYSVCSFDIFVEEVFCSLLNGAALAMPTEEEKRTLQSLMKFVELHSITLLSGFPYLLADMNPLPSIPSSLRLLISGGDVLRGVYVDRLLEHADVYNTYGPSETTVCASYYRCNDGVVLEDGTYPIGKPVKGVSIRILDKDGNEVPAGETGEVCIYGDGVSFGYIGDHEEENKAFEPQEDGTVMYRSGDLGYLLPDGNIAFLHRKDDQVMILGKRVEVAEVQSRLYQCKGVRQALVRALKDEHDLHYLVAYVVPNEDGVVLSELKAELAEHLTPFMVPEFFLTMPNIPLNTNGKPDVTQLPVVLKEGSY